MKGSEYNTMPTGSAMTSDEPGAQDNILSLDPQDSRWRDSVGNWQDDKEYTLSSVRVRQISPGKFEVLDISAQSPDSPAKEQAEPAGENEGGENETGSQTTSNPVVNDMMR